MVLPTHAGTSFSSSTQPRPRCNFPLSRSFFALRSSCLLPLLSHSGFYWAQTASQADWGNIKAEVSAKPRNALLSQCGKIMQRPPLPQMLSLCMIVNGSLCCSKPFCHLKSCDCVALRSISESEQVATLMINALSIISIHFPVERKS